MMGSDSDFDRMVPCFETLYDLGITTVRPSGKSAHRLPHGVAELVGEFEDEGVQVFITAASMAAAIAGAVAGHTMWPVIGVPLSAAPFNGLDSLLSMVQMPPDVPVATVTVGAEGPKNAAILAAQMLSIGHPEIREALLAWCAKRTYKAQGKHDNVLNKYDEWLATKTAPSS
jgi:phosphoribosylaminoimidazole carboxylase PurE protein